MATMMVPDNLPAEMREKFAAMRRAQRASKVMTIILILIIVAEFGVFWLRTYGPVTDQFHDQARVQKALNESMPIIQPVLTKTLQDVVKEVGPKYRTLAGERYEKVRAGLGGKITEKFSAIPDTAEKALGQQLQATFDKVIKRLEPELKAAFPTLTDQQRQDLVINEFHKMAEAKNEMLADKVSTIAATEHSRMKDLLDRFALPPDNAGPNNEQMNREFERIVLMLANAEIQEQIDKLNAEGAGAMSPATRPAAASPDGK